MNREYKDNLSRNVEKNFSILEDQILEDIVRRIKKEGRITSTADWQINRLVAMGYSSADVEKFIKEALDASYPEVFELYDKVIDWEYVRNKDIYEQVNEKFIPYKDNKQLQQLTSAFMEQSINDLTNLTQSLGFYLDYGGGNMVFTPLADVYTKYLDQAIYGIATGAFDYNSMLRKTVAQLTNSGLRTIDYPSGRSNRVEVAARRAVMTGVSKLTGSITEMHMKNLGTNYVEVAWHEGARTGKGIGNHQAWQGKVYEWRK